MSFSSVFKTFPALRTPRLSLRKLCASDAPAYFEALGTVDPLVWGLRAPSVEKTRTMLAGFEKGYVNKATIAWAICADDHLIGEIKLFSFIYQSKAEVAYWFSDTHRGRGYASEALQAVTEFAFSTMNLHRVEAFAQTSNMASIALLQRNRFADEGILRQWRREGDSWFDFKAFGRLRGD
ncbi:MAG TPA: GNAT family N-acetyltransferase [Tepidisphaeraceae bacterium]|jgi:ribosomal-protein-alanine N-acetyltransferase